MHSTERNRFYIMCLSVSRVPQTQIGTVGSSAQNSILSLNDMCKRIKFDIPQSGKSLEMYSFY